MADAPQYTREHVAIPYKFVGLGRAIICKEERLTTSIDVRWTVPYARRQVIPVIASSSDGVEQRTIILAVERNTKVLGPVNRDPGA